MLIYVGKESLAGFDMPTIVWEQEVETLVRPFGHRDEVREFVSDIMGWENDMLICFPGKTNIEG